jgi:hypothetical protein
MADTNTTGAYPLDPDTTVGLLRAEVGDIVGTPHDDDPTLADYEYLGDKFLTALLTAYPDSSSMALARALGSMATQMIAAAQDIQVDDIKIKTVAKAELMLKRASDLESGAASWDAGTAFQVVQLVPASDYDYVPQGSPVPQRGGWGTPGAIGPSGF